MAKLIVEFDYGRYVAEDGSTSDIDKAQRFDSYGETNKVLSAFAKGAVICLPR